MDAKKHRKNLITSLLSKPELEDLKREGIYQNFIQGSVSLHTVLNRIKDQGV